MLIDLIRIGTSSNKVEQRKLNDKWWDEPVETFKSSLNRQVACVYLPDGHTIGEMRWDAHFFMNRVNPDLATKLPKAIRKEARHRDLVIYVGTPRSLDALSDGQLLAYVQPYIIRRRTSLIIDAMSNADEERWSSFFEMLRPLFRHVAIEGCFKHSNIWMKERGFKNVVMADAWEDLYSKNDDFIKPGKGDVILVSNGPSREWKIEQARIWRNRGCHVIAESSILDDM